MGINELRTARARRAAAKLEVLLAEIERGYYDLGPDRARVVGAHIRRTLGTFWDSLGEGGHDVSGRGSDRRANG